jgi:dinuclear metal center YbgI/SA1388 family protein
VSRSDVAETSGCAYFSRVANLHDIARRLDEILRPGEIPDSDLALNGLQLENRGEIAAVAAAVDFRLDTIRGATRAGASLLIVHHGMFWNGLGRIVGSNYERTRACLESDLAIYASHIPLDLHPELGNNVLLARALHLEPSFPFARYRDVAIGVGGTTNLDTAVIADRARAFAEQHAGHIRTTGFAPGRRTRRWGICTGAGASIATLEEARSLAIDTLIVGEGPHHTAVFGEELDIAVIYAGHYATETLGVIAVAQRVGAEFGIPWSFVPAPTGL